MSKSNDVTSDSRRAKQSHPSAGRAAGDLPSIQSVHDIEASGVPHERELRRALVLSRGASKLLSCLARAFKDAA